MLIRAKTGDWVYGDSMYMHSPLQFSVHIKLFKILKVHLKKTWYFVVLGKMVYTGGSNVSM